MRITLALLATLAVLVTAIVPAFCVAAVLAATGSRMPAIVILVALVTAAAWSTAVALPLRVLERRLWRHRGVAFNTSIGAVLGFTAGFFLRDFLFTIGPNSDYPAAAYALLYAITFLGALALALVRTLRFTPTDLRESGRAA